MSALQQMMTAFKPSAAGPHDIVWANLTHLSVVTGNEVTASGGDDNWNPGASSTESISGDGYLEITVVYNASPTNRMFGLGTLNTGGSYPRIDYAIFLFNGTDIYVFENGNSRGGIGSFTIGDVLRVQKTGSTVTYKKNGTVIYTSGVSSSTVLYANATVQLNGRTQENITLGPTFA